MKQLNMHKIEEHEYYTDLYYELEDLFEDLFFKMTRIDLANNIIRTKKTRKKLKNLYDNIEFYYYHNAIGDPLEEELNSIYDKLVEKSTKEEYLFIGADYKTLVKCILKNIPKSYNPSNQHQEDCHLIDKINYLEEYIDFFDYTIKHRLAHILDLEDGYKFKAYRYILFLEPEKIERIKINLKKTVFILEQELKKYQPKTTTSKDNLKKEKWLQKLDYNPKLWNKKSYLFLLFLIEHFYTNKKSELTYIWRFLKRDLNKKDYIFNATQAEYTIFIKENLRLELKNWQITNFVYEDEFKPALLSCLEQFEETQKQIIK